MRQVTTRILGISLATLVLIASAYADIVFTPGDHPQPNEENILFHTPQTGSTIQGFTNHTDTMVLFTSTTDTLTAKGGQSDVDAVDGEINDITLKVPGHTFTDLIINPLKPVNANDLMVTVLLTDGKTFTDTYGSIHGNNFLTITSANGELISSVTIDSTGGFQSLSQPRISGISATVVPEPSSLLLLGSGLLGLAPKLRRKRLS